MFLETPSNTPHYALPGSIWNWVVFLLPRTENIFAVIVKYSSTDLISSRLDPSKSMVFTIVKHKQVKISDKKEQCFGDILTLSSSSNAKNKLSGNPMK